jgi:hypothetical protein
VYAFVRNQWLECIADDYAQVHGRSEREWHLILDEWRAHPQAVLTLGTTIERHINRVQFKVAQALVKYLVRRESTTESVGRITY